ncbi:MAG: protein kinase, partial [Verrucomicrobiota bacterium]
MKSALESSVDPDATVVMSTDERKAQRQQLPVPGATFGDYEIERELGRGGMGAVFEAQQTETGRRVALKVLSHKLDNADARARFLREGRLAASINHPNSVYVFGTEEIGGTPAISMELIAGGTLEERVRQDGPLPVGEAVDAVLQLIGGLEEAQKTGILHRDIKPANCFEDRDGSVKIGDFGLSISTEGRDDTNLTLEGTFLGTPAFSSPEQLRGEELSVRSDIYSVGVTLYFLLTGKTPFEGKSAAQIFANVLEKTAPSPSEHRADLPSKLAKIVMRCIEKTPSDRFKNYAELRAALAPFGLEATTPAFPPMRVLAMAIDMMLLSMMWITTSILLTGNVVSTQDPDSYVTFQNVGLLAISFAINICYFGFLEGIHGAALGKWICRIRVAGRDRNPPGFFRGSAR